MGNLGLLISVHLIVSCKRWCLQQIFYGRLQSSHFGPDKSPFTALVLVPATSRLKLQSVPTGPKQLSQADSTGEIPAVFSQCYVTDSNPFPNQQKCIWIK